MPGQQGKIPIGISSCLLGEKVRYDGGHKKNACITGTLAEYFHFIPFCPEVAAGLGVPRPAVQLRRTSRGIRCLGVEERHLDVTDALNNCAKQQRNWLSGVCGYILKKNSPSCGMQDVRIFGGDMPEQTGAGLFAEFIRQNFPLLPLLEEDRLHDAPLCESFLQRVQVLQRWRQLLARPLTPCRLRNFHRRHRLLAMSRDPELAEDLAHLTAGAEPGAILRDADRYIHRLLTGLKKTASRSGHVAVLRHIQRLLKQSLTPEDSAALQAAIESYRNRKAALALPVGVANAHLPEHPEPVLQRCCYLHPGPAVLALYRKL